MSLRVISVGIGVALLALGSARFASAAEGRLPASLFVRVAQSSDAAATNTASRAVDGATTTFSLTTNAPGLA